jgi:hypothetical protein
LPQRPILTSQHVATRTVKLQRVTTRAYVVAVAPRNTEATREGCIPPGRAGTFFVPSGLIDQRPGTSSMSGAGSLPGGAGSSSGAGGSLGGGMSPVLGGIGRPWGNSGSGGSLSGLFVGPAILCTPVAAGSEQVARTGVPRGEVTACLAARRRQSAGLRPKQEAYSGQQELTGHAGYLSRRLLYFLTIMISLR